MSTENWKILKDYMFGRFPFWRPTISQIEVPAELLSLKSIPINRPVYELMLETVYAFNELRENKTYQRNIKEKALDIAKQDPGNHSILMSFDFHVSDSEAKLIEINTNASFATVVWALSEKNATTLPSSVKEFDRSLKAAMISEGKALGINHLDFRIAIIDDNPTEQNAYFEFLLYKELFENWGWDTVICDPKDLYWNPNTHSLSHEAFGEINFIYNRNCDFLFEESQNAHLKDAFLSKTVCFSPNPHEYNLLANKERLVELSDPNFLNSLQLSEKAKRAINNAVLKTFPVTKLSKEELWTKRKELFFKPKMAYGSKAVYRGSSVSRKAFDSIYTDEFVAQEYFPPSVYDDFKYDIRVYTFRDEVQLAAARLYQGQVTNVRTLGGGLATLEII